jgi:serine/threonine-protein kinase
MMAAGATTSIPPVGYDDYDDRYAPARHGGGRRWIPWVLGLLLVLGVVGGAAYYLLGANKGTSIPQVAGQTVAQAERALTNAHLRFATQNVASSQYKAGLVTGSNPPEGNNVATNSLVTLLVSSGAPTVTVPGVIGDQLNTAEAALQAKGFAFVTKTDPTSTQPSGTVTNQSPKGQTQAAQGSTVTLYVSGSVQVPNNLIGLSQTAATQELQADGFKVATNPVAGPAGTTAGNVWNVSPQPGTTVAPGSTVTIFVQPQASASASPSPTGSASGTLTSPPPSNTP